MICAGRRLQPINRERGGGMDAEVERALATDRVIDITTTGRSSGEPRRIEIWFTRLDGRYFITGAPTTPRSWYANLVAHPEFVFHLKESVTADLSATARPIIETTERREVFDALLPVLGPDMAVTYPTEEWLTKAPLVEVVL